MGLLDTLLGRSKPVRPNLDALFALPSAAITLQAASGLAPTGGAGVCYKPPAGADFDQLQSEIEQLLATADSGSPAGTSSEGTTSGISLGLGDDGSGTAAGAATDVRHESDSYGYRWLVFDGGAIDDLVTRVHLVHSSLEDSGWGPQLLCSVFAFAGSAESSGPRNTASPVFLVYLAKRGTFYPFAPSGRERRDSELELRLRSIVAGDLPLEADMSRWFPLWGLPVR